MSERVYIRTAVIALLMMGFAVFMPQSPFLAAAQSSDFNRVFSDYEEYEGSVYMGISGPYTDKNTAYRKALENACTMAALSQSLRMRADLDMVTDTRHDRNSFRVYSAGSYDGTVYEAVMAGMEIEDLIWYGGDIGAVAFIKYGDGTRIQWDHDRTWVASSIEVPGYAFAVGTVGEYYYIQDSINAAAYEGAVNLVLNHQKSIIAVNEEITMNNTDMMAYSYQIGFNILKGFTVLAYYYDPDNRTYTALVGAKL